MAQDPCAPAALARPSNLYPRIWTHATWCVQVCRLSTAACDQQQCLADTASLGKEIACCHGMATVTANLRGSNALRSRHSWRRQVECCGARHLGRVVDAPLARRMDGCWFADRRHACGGRSRPPGWASRTRHMSGLERLRTWCRPGIQPRDADLARPDPRPVSKPLCTGKK